MKPSTLEALCFLHSAAKELQVAKTGTPKSSLYHADGLPDTRPPDDKYFENYSKCPPDVTVGVISTDFVNTFVFHTVKITTQY